uniref:Uncharacterized protein n=1 Tax=Quercus lobata TaxID=97700 RepID=A0A7N2LMX0_QUELO
MCRCSGKTMKDLLIHCDVARPLEQCSLDIWDSLGAALYYANIIVWKHSSDVWNLVLACLIWLVWKERDSRMFEDAERSLDQLKKQRELIREVQDVTHLRELESVFGVSFASYVILLF